MSWSGIPELKEGYQKLGPRKFWPVMIGTLLYIGSGAWLMISAQWPADCRPQGRDLIGAYYCSPGLLSGGTMEIGAFIWLWAIPAAVIVAYLHRKLGEWRRPKL
jgi:hypothetical protein